MFAPSPDHDRVEALVGAFRELQRHGETPSLVEYLERYPDLADQLASRLADEPPPIEGSFLVDQELAAPIGRVQVSRIGDFRILREIGRGGMGVVYEAEQESLGRRVALKVLTQSLNDPKRVQRFEREARAAGRLHHTNIVPVYGVGQEHGIHYYVMQYIHGYPLNLVLNEFRRLRSQEQGASVATAILSGSAKIHDPKRVSTPPHANNTQRQDRFVPAGEFAESESDVLRDLSATEFDLDESPIDPSALTRPVSPTPAAASEAATSTTPTASASAGRFVDRAYARSVARIGLQIAQALEYTASQGIVHRDVKPSNLLLDSQGTVWITDFGLAKAADQEDLTLSGDLVGTLRYMSPEQFQGKADAKSDVYALGLTLYELLALRPAFDATDRTQLMNQMAQTEPPLLTRLDPGIPRDMATIVHKAIQREPADRYASPGDLAADLERFLDDQPIAARRLSPCERARRWYNRHPGVACLLALLVLVLACVAVGSSIAAVRFNQLADSEHQAHEVAVRRASEANAVVDFLIKGLLNGASPDQRAASGELSLDDFLDQADRLCTTEFADQPLLEASIRAVLGQAYWKLGRYGDAERNLTRARDLQTKWLGPEDPDTLATLDRLAWVLAGREKYQEAYTLFKDVMETRLRVFGESDPATLNAMKSYALSLNRRGRHDEAESLLRAVLEKQRQSQGYESNDAIYTMHDLATTLRRRHQLEKAQTLAEETLRLQKRVLGPRAPATLLGQQNLAEILAERGELSKARALFESTLQDQRQVLRSNHVMTTWTISGLSHVLMRLGELKKAESLLLELAEIQRKSLGPAHLATINALLNLAETQARLEDWQQAATHFQEVLDVRPEVESAWRSIAVLTLLQNDREGFQRHCESMLRQFGGSKDPELAARIATIVALAPVELPAQSPLFESLREVVAGNPAQCRYAMALGIIEARAGNVSRAVELLNSALGRLGDPILEAQTGLVLATIHGREKRPDDARQAFEKAERQLNALVTHQRNPASGASWLEWRITLLLRRDVEARIETSDRPLD